MDKKEVIIIPNELEVNINPFYFSCKELHIEGLKKFIYQYDLSISSPIIKNADKVSKELADDGFCIIHTDEFDKIKNLLVYLPIKITNKQLEYFYSKQEDLKKYNLMLLTKEETDNFKVIDQTTTEKPIIDILMEELNNRLITKAKRKVLTPKN